MNNHGISLHDPQLFVPEYKPMRAGAWEIRQSANVLCQGYWGLPVLMPCLTALIRGGDVWMSITPLELESQSIGINRAKGHVAIFGLGMGWAAAATALNPSVTAVSVIEADAEVLALHRKLDIFSQIPAECREKLQIVHSDAFAWKPSRPVDLLMPDIWLPLVSDGRVEEVQRMQDNVQASGIYFWGQELEIARHAVAAGRAIDDKGIATTVADFHLPLIGMDTIDYSMRVLTAANRWMGDRWL